jgi:hypothetical protein
MKYWIMNTLFATLLAAPLAACALGGGEADNEIDNVTRDETGELSEATTERASCCSSGAYYCPSASDLDSFDYAPPRCDALTKPGARLACERACDVTCVDTGWSSSC